MKTASELGITALILRMWCLLNRCCSTAKSSGKRRNSSGKKSKSVRLLIQLGYRLNKELN